MGNAHMTLLVDGRNAFPEIIRCIGDARTSVQINMFIWRDDEIGNAMAKAVLEAADRGVQVAISVDRYGVTLEKSEECKRSFFNKKLTIKEQLQVWGLELFYPENGRRGIVRDECTPLYNRIITHPRITVSADVWKADHSKYYIIDDEILFLGGINIEDKENGCDISGRVYGDYMVKLQGRTYVEALRKKLTTGENTLEELFFGVNRKNPTRCFEMERFYLELIREAKQELHITMAYFSPLKKFTEAILDAHRRGVRVTVVIPEKANFQNSSNRRMVRRLLKATNGEIGVFLSPRMLHTKLVMNESWVSLGSTNITKKAFKELDELNLFVKRRDTAFERALRESIAKDKAEAKRISCARQVRYNRLMAFLESFMV